MIHKIVEERKRNGPCLSLSDFIYRTEIKREQLEILLRIDALRFTGKTKQELLWEEGYYLQPKKTGVGALELFRQEVKPEPLPELEVGDFEDAFTQIELLGFPLCPPLICSGQSSGER